MSTGCLNVNSVDTIDCSKFLVSSKMGVLQLIIFFDLTNTDYSLVELPAQLKNGALPPHQQYILSLNLNRYLLKNDV